MKQLRMNSIEQRHAELRAREAARAERINERLRAERDNARLTNASSRGRYEAAELRPFAGRPGAMDAFALPSLVNGRRVARRIGVERA